MACRGVYFALTPEQEKRLLACSSDQELTDLVIEEIETAWDEDHLCEADKAWDAIHRVLGDGSLRPKRKISLERVVLGGKPLYKGNDYIITYLTVSEVAELAVELQPITETWFRDRYFALKKKTFFQKTPLNNAQSFSQSTNEIHFRFDFAPMKFLKSLILSLLHWRQIEQAVTHWRFSLPMTVGMAASCVLYFYTQTPAEGIFVFLFLLITGMTIGLVWDKQTPTD